MTSDWRCSSRPTTLLLALVALLVSCGPPQSAPAATALPATAMPTAAAPTLTATRTAARAPPRLNLRQTQDASKVFRPIELAIDIDGVFDNPFDPAQADLWVRFVAPSGKEMRVPAFWSQDFDPATLQPVAEPERHKELERSNQVAFFDLPLDRLRDYLPPRDEPADFDAFWRQTLETARQTPLEATFEPVDYGLATLETFDVTFRGYGGQPIKGWLLLPRARERRVDGRLPCVVEYLGYGGGRGFPTDWLLWSSMGYAHLVMDTRGQGSTWLKGDTPDPELEGGNPQHPGFMTRGILNPQTYYYRRVFTDAARAVEAARAHPAIDAARIAVTGGSQGGGIALAVSGLVPDVQAAMPDVPFLCHYRRATEITDGYPYQEIARYLMIHRDKEATVFATLAYFDGVNFAARARATALFSAGLMDEICPPSTVFAAYNHYAGPKEIRVWRYNHHEGGASYQVQEKVRFLRSLWG